MPLTGIKRFDPDLILLNLTPGRHLRTRPFARASENDRDNGLDQQPSTRVGGQGQHARLLGAAARAMDASACAP
jgi:hypothetical protein